MHICIPAYCAFVQMIKWMPESVRPSSVCLSVCNQRLIEYSARLGKLKFKYIQGVFIFLPYSFQMFYTFSLPPLYIITAYSHPSRHSSCSIVSHIARPLGLLDLFDSLKGFDASKNQAPPPSSPF